MGGNRKRVRKRKLEFEGPATQENPVKKQKTENENNKESGDKDQKINKSDNNSNSNVVSPKKQNKTKKNKSIESEPEKKEKKKTDKENKTKEIEEVKNEEKIKEAIEEEEEESGDEEDKLEEPVPGWMSNGQILENWKEIPVNELDIWLKKSLRKRLIKYLPTTKKNIAIEENKKKSKKEEESKLFPVQAAVLPAVVRGVQIVQDLCPLYNRTDSFYFVQFIFNFLII